jgi:peptide/nickel transport system substrate-binding protein
LTDSINRDELIKNSLYGHGVPIFGPTKTLQPELKSNYSTENTATSTQVERAKNILEGAGWTQNSLHLWEKKIDNEQVVLSITLRTSNASLFNELVESIAKQWEAIGVEVTTEQFEQTGLVQSVIRPRDFEALLFGLEMSRSYDLYPFWHSSQQSDPGLNIAQYTNVRVDELLAKTRTEQSEQVRIETLNEASAIITKESPAIFLFQPTFTYIVDEHIFVTEMKNIGRPADRFSNVTDWHTESDSLWSLFDENSI